MSRFRTYIFYPSDFCLTNHPAFVPTFLEFTFDFFLFLNRDWNLNVLHFDFFFSKTSFERFVVCDWAQRVKVIHGSRRRGCLYNFGDTFARVRGFFFLFAAWFFIWMRWIEWNPPFFLPTLFPTARDVFIWYRYSDADAALASDKASPGKLEENVPHLKFSTRKIRTETNRTPGNFFIFQISHISPFKPLQKVSKMCKKNHFENKIAKIFHNFTQHFWKSLKHTMHYQSI